jgi:diaminohydroxyphosphoribosylaminopyrimidine deaminase/5-amino-6-(5-phosphoribosylamino)uracil reductase
MMDVDVKIMNEAITLAEKGRGWVNPNPLVGSIIFKDGRIIGRGYHKRYGFDHAEVEAVKDALKKGFSVEGGRMYVTLEPCSHHGKTPPCAEFIVRSGIKEVVIGMKDPNPKVCGGGIKVLNEAGIDVKIGVLAEQVARQNEVFLKQIITHLPFITLKIAASIDGKISSALNGFRYITCDESRRIVHRLRYESDVVMTGVGTVLADDPMLDCRLEINEHKNPVRAVMDTNLRIPLSSKVVKTASEIRTIVFTRNDNLDSRRVIDLESYNVEVVGINETDGGLNLVNALSYLWEQQLTAVMVEAGSKLLSSFIATGLFDKIIYFIAPKFLGVEDSLPILDPNRVLNLSTPVELLIGYIEKVGQDIMVEAYPAAVPAYTLLEDKVCLQV